MAKPSITQTTPYDSPGLVFDAKVSAKFQLDHPNGGAK